MNDLILLVISGVLIEAVILLLLAISMVKLSKSKTHPGISFSIFLTGLLFLLYVAYQIIKFGLDSMNLGNDTFYGGIFSVYGDIGNNIWFGIGSYMINYSIVKGSITLISASGIFLGVIKFLVGLFRKR